MFRDDLEKVLHPIIDEHDKKLLEAAIPNVPIKHMGARKEREILFDALCGGCGLEREGMTAPMKRTIAVALSTIMAVMPRLTPEEITSRCREYKRKHPQWDITPTSIAKHWGSLACASSIHGLLDEPAGWRDRVGEIFPEEDNGATGLIVGRTAWAKIAKSHQEKICRLMEQIAKEHKA